MMKKLFFGWLIILFLLLIPTLTLADEGYTISGPANDSKKIGIGAELYMPGGAEVSLTYNVTSKFGLQALIGFQEWTVQDMYGIKALYRIANLNIDNYPDIGNLYGYGLYGLYTLPDQQTATVSGGLGMEVSPFFLPEQTLRFVVELGLIMAEKSSSVFPTYNFGIRYYF